MSLQPRGDTNRNRSQQARSGQAKSSGPAVINGQATKLLRKANNAGLAVEDTLSDNPFTAYNHARFGITISSMEMVTKIAHMKIANPGRTRAMIERGSGYEVDAKLCYSVRDNALQINDTEVYVAFMDRFYNVPETAIMALAVIRSGAGPFSILGFVNGAILELNSDPPIMMAQPLTFAQQQVRHAFATCRNLPEFVIQQEVSIPEGYADLGDRQLNEILSNTATTSGAVTRMMMFKFSSMLPELSSQDPTFVMRPVEAAVGLSQHSH